jgi:glucokinase
MLQIGFDVGGRKIAVGVVDESKQIVARRKIPFPTGRNYQQVATMMADLVWELSSEVQVPVREFQSIGISIPGSLNTTGDYIIDAHNLEFHNVPFREEMSKHFPQVPIFLANDANAAALAELHAGAFKGCETALLVTLGTGIGGGIILGGKMFNGGLGHGVELGHMCLVMNGPLCTCGNRGCIETLCAAPWLEQQGRKAIEDFPMSLIATEAEGNSDNSNAKLVIDCAKQGDDIAMDIFNRYVDQLSTAITSLVVLLDPEVVALGGGVSLAGEFLFQPIREQVESKSFFKYAHKIVPAVLGNDAGIIGAAMLAYNNE